MKIVKMKIADLNAPEKNVRIHTESQINEFVRSIQMFGQIRPVVVDENNVILAGNGLVLALTKAGINEADVLKIDDLTSNQKKKLMIADNKIFNLGIENLDTLNAFLEELQGDLDIPGFDEEILKTMVAEGEAVTNKIAQYGTLDEDEIQNIKQAAERKENSTSTGAAQIINDYPADDEPSDDTTDIRKFVVCPKCGEKLWL